MRITVSPAYGRDYKSARAAGADAAGLVIMIRYNRMTKVVPA
jgi:hypothetical protein